jgi:CubicO group peptidase (beta-lactamase class C family)
LRHTSGLPAHRSFYETVMVEPESERQNLMRQLVFKEPLVAEPGQKQIYSDLGYIILAWVIEKVAGCKLDKFVREEIYQPLGIKDLFFIRINNKNRIRFNSKKYKLFVPTEICPWRKKMLRAEVHDDNAWSVGGIDGHAGLFGTASGVWEILNEIMSVLHGKESILVNRAILKGFLEKKGRVVEVAVQSVTNRKPEIVDKFDMVAGFDTPSLKGSSAGRYFSPDSIGHLGFTGTSFWMDPLKSLIVVLLSNRVHPTRNNQKIKEFRSEKHDLIFETLFL